MRAVCFEEVGQVKLIDLADPQLIDADDAIVEVEVAGLCGSDLHPFFGRESGLDRHTVMGHEMVGKIVALGEQAAQVADPDHQVLEIGDRVYMPFSTSCGSCFYCRLGLTARCEGGQLFGWRQAGKGLHGCQAEYVRVPLAKGTLLKIPEGIDANQALLLGDNFSTGFYCAEMANLQPGGVAAVIGCGTVGQLCLQVAAKMECRNLFAIDPVPSRRVAAERWGAIPLSPEEAPAAIAQINGGRGCDAVMELVGLPDAQRLAFQIIRPGGTMSVIGCHCTPQFAFSPVDAYDKNLTYRTGRCSARFYMEKLTPDVAAKTFDLSGVITHEFDPSECERAYEVFSQQQDGCIKAVFRF